MPAEYHFVTNWTIPGTAHEVAEVLGDPLELLRRRAPTDAERLAVPSPPGPTFARHASS